MTVSVEDVCNQALDLLTEAPITSLAQDTKAARLCSRHFETTRMSELKKHAWTFAILRVEPVAADLMGLDGTNNVYRYGFEVPADALRVLPMTDTGEPFGRPVAWKREGNLILTDYSDSPVIRYVGNVIDPDDWDPQFIEALAAKLALKIALPLTQKTTFVQAAQNAYNEAIRTAKRSNLIESGSQASSPSWAHARGDYSGWAGER